VWPAIRPAALSDEKDIRERGFSMDTLKFIGRRLIYLVVMLFGVATLVFILTKMVPGDPVTANLSQRALNDPEIVAAYRAKHGLDQPVIIQYFLYIRNLLQFDLGTSIRTNTPVLQDLQRCFPASGSH
jgi:peptide/nickel transport system permease protein